MRLSLLKLAEQLKEITCQVCGQIALLRSSSLCSECRRVYGACCASPEPIICSRCWRAAPKDD